MPALLSLLSLSALAFGETLQAPPEIIKQVQDHQKDVDRIIDLVSPGGAAYHQAYNRLAAFVDTIGARVSGSPELEKAVTYMQNALTSYGLENVHVEEVTIPSWIRGAESLVMTSPRKWNLTMLGLGQSVATPKGGITADALVVTTFDELAQRKADAKGKIVVYNQQCDWVTYPTQCYGKSVAYRSSGGATAAQYGALAVLVRSVTPYSLATPHTGGTSGPIPAASITVEDAEMMARMQAAGQRITLTLNMGAVNGGDRKGHNVVAEWKGSTYPDQVVLVSGHLDSWDVGQGALDDGGGVAISVQALTMLKQLGLRAKRTIRAVLWSSEEFGGVGARQYYQAHKGQIANMDLVMESDLGVFSPYGIQFTGNAAARAVMTEVGKLLKSINASVVTDGGEGTDISPWIDAGVPGASLANHNENYFRYHHTNADTMTALNADDMDMCAAVWCATAYVVADLDDLLPRRNRTTDEW